VNAEFANLYREMQRRADRLGILHAACTLILWPNRRRTLSPTTPSWPAGRIRSCIGGVPKHLGLIEVRNKIISNCVQETEVAYIHYFRLPGTWWRQVCKAS